MDGMKVTQPPLAGPPGSSTASAHTPDKDCCSPFWDREEERETERGMFINQVVTGRVIGYFPRCVSLRDRLHHQSMNVETERAINDWNIPLTLRNPKMHQSIA